MISEVSEKQIQSFDFQNYRLRRSAFPLRLFWHSEASERHNIRKLSYQNFAFGALFSVYCVIPYAIFWVRARPQHVTQFVVVKPGTTSRCVTHCCCCSCWVHSLKIATPSLFSTVAPALNSGWSLWGWILRDALSLSPRIFGLETELFLKGCNPVD